MGGPSHSPEIIRSLLSLRLLVLGKEKREAWCLRLNPRLKQAQNPFLARCWLLTDPALRYPFSDPGCFCHSAGASVWVHTGFAGLRGCRTVVPGTGNGQLPRGCDELLPAARRPGGPWSGRAAVPQSSGLGCSSQHPGRSPGRPGRGLWATLPTCVIVTAMSSFLLSRVEEVKHI